MASFIKLLLYGVGPVTVGRCLVLVRVTVTVRLWPYHTCAKAGRPYLGQNSQVPESNEVMASKLVFRKSGVRVSYYHALFAHWIVLQIHCSLCVRACVCVRTCPCLTKESVTP